MQYIEILTATETSVEIESYEAVLELSVSAGRRRSCFDISLSLRSQVIEELKNVGIAIEDVHEGGGDATHNKWSAQKFVSHRILIRNEKMELLMSAMAAVERLFASQKEPMFSGIKKNFTFRNPVPVCSSNSDSIDEALANAMHQARMNAESLAAAQEMAIDSLVFVVELASSPRHDMTQSQFDAGSPDSSVDFCLSESNSIGAISYDELAQPSKHRNRLFRVRYSVKSNGEPLKPGSKNV